MTECTCNVSLSLPEGFHPDDLPPFDAKINHCTLHKAAPDLLDAAIQARAVLLTVLRDYEKAGQNVAIGVIRQKIKTLDQAIAAAEGGE